MSDKTQAFWRTFAIVIVALSAAGFSAIHVYSVSLYYRQPGFVAFGMPACIDGAVLACSMVMLAAARAGDPTPGLARVGLLSGILATVAANLDYGITANIGHGLGAEIGGAITSAWPAYMFIISAEVALSLTRRTARKRRTGTRASGSDRAAPLDQTAPRQPDAPADTAPESAPPTAPESAPPTAPESAPVPRQPGTRRRTDAEQYPDDAVAAYRASVDLGSPLSARTLAPRFFDGNRRAAGRMIAALANGHGDLS